MLIKLTKEKMEESFLQYLEGIFEHPEIISATVRDIVITRETIDKAGRQAFEVGFHDIYSDIDLSVKETILIASGLFRFRLWENYTAKIILSAVIWQI